MLEGERTQLISRVRARISKTAPEKNDALRADVSGETAATDACLQCWSFALERGQEWSDPAPAAVRIHARRAACYGTTLAEVLHPYRLQRDLVWKSVLGEFDGVDARELHVLLRQAWAATESLFARVLEAAEDAYADEAAHIARTPDQRQPYLVRRVLAGDFSVDLRTIRHDFSGRQLGLIAVDGNRARTAINRLAEYAGCRLFMLPPEEDGLLTAWLRLSRELERDDLDRHLPVSQYPELVLGVGCVAEGIEGFRRTHRSALEAFTVARRLGHRIEWHADVEVDALLLRDEQLARSLVARYISPLTPRLMQTLRTWCAESGNESATARTLSLNRSTIQERVERINKLIGRPPEACRLHIELAIRAADLGIGIEVAVDGHSTRHPAGEKFPKPTNMLGSVRRST